MAVQQTEAAVVSGKTTPRRIPSRSWRHWAYRAVRRGIGLQLAQVWGSNLSAIAEPRWDDTYEFRQLAADDVYRLAADPANDLTHDIALRLAESKHRCFAAFDGPNLACYTWCATSNVGSEDTLCIPLALPGGTCYLFRSFALPAYRGRGIYMLMTQRVLAEFGRLGSREAIALIEYGNVASMRSHTRIGLWPYGWIMRLGLGKLVCRWYASATWQCGFGDPLV
jgi:hypothetical protein